MDANLDFGKCFDCGSERSNARWCKVCEYNAFKENFSNWTSDFFGITKDYTSHYMFVMKYYEFYENRDLYSYLDETQGKLSWRDTAEMLWNAIDVSDPSENFDLGRRSNLKKNGAQQKIHPEALYTSRFLYFPELYNPVENVYKLV
ncbi:13261_t:CDS:2 [Funneliformis caledonium]|uniref:13261_t:CDS:1 n=1 Tax=Funneliformis caledonium TaxID=1117310 RepID=A0A9N8Z2I8_9GLOM|nr:13261_t:CDS:2 [Funneliformis caledonium]